MVNWRGVVLSFVLTMTGILTTFFYLRGVESQIYAGLEMKEVVVFQKDLPPAHVVSQEDVAIKALPQNTVLPQALTKISDALGREILFPVWAGEQAITTKMSSPGERSLRSRLPQGYRAMTVTVKNPAPLDGEIKVGDYVDLIAVDNRWGEGVSKTILERVLVIGLANQESSALWEDGGLKLVCITRLL